MRSTRGRGFDSIIPAIFVFSSGVPILKSLEALSASSRSFIDFSLKVPEAISIASNDQVFELAQIGNDCVSDAKDLLTDGLLRSRDLIERKLKLNPFQLKQGLEIKLQEFFEVVSQKHSGRNAV